MRIETLICGLLLMPGAAWGQRLEAKLNEFGNPVGKGFSLADDGEFRGKVLLAWSTDGEVARNVFPETNPLWTALKAKGFEVRIEQGRFDPAWLQTADQLWIFSGREQGGIDQRGFDAVVKFVEKGKGLYLASDNEPYLVESAVLAQRLFGAAVKGNFGGDQIIAVRGRGMTRDDLAKSRRSGGNAPRQEQRQGLEAREPVKLPPGAGRIEVVNRASHYVEDHALLSGINFIHEGVTISHIGPSGGLQTVLTASDGQVLAAVARDLRMRVLVDCGWTRYYVSFVNKTAGTIRYAENVAAYLMGKDSRVVTKVSELRGNAVGFLKGLQASKVATKRRPLADELAKTSPRYSDVKDQIDEIWEFAGSQDDHVAAAARSQIVNAFQRAPMSHCLYWIGRAEEELAALIWQQVNARTAQADAPRRAGYADSAVAVLKHDESSQASRKAAIELLAKLNDRQVVGKAVEPLLDLPRDLWPDVGKLLRDLTGEDFGPHPGDGIAGVLEAKKKWEAWLRESGP